MLTIKVVIFNPKCSPFVKLIPEKGIQHCNKLVEAEEGRSGPVHVISPQIYSNQSANPNKFRGNIGQTWMWSVMPYYPQYLSSCYLLSSVRYKIFCPTYVHSLMIWLWRRTSIFVLIPHHLTLDGCLVFWTLSTSTNTLTFLPTFTVILSTLGFALRDATFSLFWPLNWFRTTFLLLLTCKFYPIIVRPSHKLPSTERCNQSTLKPSRLKIQNSDLIRYPKQMQLNWLYNMTVSSALSSIFMPHWLPKRSL